MVDSKSPNSTSILIVVLRLVKLTLVGAATAVVFAVGASQWQDWSSRARERAHLHEMESHSLGLDNLPSAESFYPVRVVPRQPVVAGFEQLTVAEAEGKIFGRELVLAVKIGDEARAYPLNSLNGPTREIINDVVGGRTIAATW